MKERKEREMERERERERRGGKKGRIIAFSLIWSLNFTEVLPVIPSEFTLWYVVICRRCDRLFASADILLIPSAGPTSSSHIKREEEKNVSLCYPSLNQRLQYFSRPPPDE